MQASVLKPGRGERAWHSGIADAGMLTAVGRGGLCAVKPA